METREEIETTLNQHFKDIMTKTIHNDIGDIDQITRNMPSLITQEHNERLMNHMSLAEVEEAVFQMEEGKAMGSYGFMVKLFHHFRDIIKQEV